MPSLQDIVQVNITLESSALSVKGFNSLLIAGKSQSFAEGQPMSFTVGEVRKYTSLAQVQADSGIKSDGVVYDMASVAFAQQPSTAAVYIGYAKDTTSDADVSIEADDIIALRASNDEWFGYVSEFNDATSIATQDTSLNGEKYGFYLIEGAVDSIPSGLDSLSHYSSLWHTKSTDQKAKLVQVAVASRLLALKPGSYTGAYKTLEGVSASQYTSTEEGLLRPTDGTPAHRINQYSTVAGRAITWEAVTASTAILGFIDTYIGQLYLQARLEEDIFAQLARSPKIPYTDAGVQTLTSTIQLRLNESVRDGFLKASPAPVVQAPRINEIPDTVTSSRQLPDINFVAETAGAIHTVIIDGKISV